jgi:hypothetical protein
MFQKEGYDFMAASFEVYKPDLLVFGGIVVELKAVTELLPEHEAQLFNYMRVSRRTVGYLVNFGHKGGLQWKRFILSDLHMKPVPAMPAAGRPEEDRHTDQP